MRWDFGGSWERVGVFCIWEGFESLGVSLQGSPHDSCFLVFILLCSFLPHWIGLTKLGHKRHWGLHLAPSGIICFGEASCLPCYEDTQATLSWGPSDKDQIFPAKSQHELTSHMNKLSQKQIFQTQLCLQITAAPADLTTVSWETPCRDHPVKPLLNSWPTETEKCWLLV